MLDRRAGQAIFDACTALILLLPRHLLLLPPCAQVKASAAALDRLLNGQGGSLYCWVPEIAAALAAPEGGGGGSVHAAASAEADPARCWRRLLDAVQGTPDNLQRLVSSAARLWGRSRMALQGVAVVAAALLR